MNSVIFINLTPHTITMVSHSGETIEVFESAGMARVNMVQEVIGRVGQFTLYRTGLGDQVTGLPDPQPDTFFIVSRQVAEAIPQRNDLVCVHQTVRENGRIVGATSFCRPC